MALKLKEFDPARYLDDKARFHTKETHGEVKM
jgi:hypothetical protein